MALKKKQIEIVISEDGDPKIDLLCGEGPSCAKEMAEWTALAGGEVVAAKKPEYYKSGQKVANVNIQKK